MASFYLDYFFADAISKYRHSLRSWGLGLQSMNLQGDMMQTRSQPPNNATS